MARLLVLRLAHFVGNETATGAHFDYLRRTARHYAGPVVIADDLYGY